MEPREEPEERPGGPGVLKTTGRGPRKGARRQTRRSCFFCHRTGNQPVIRKPISRTEDRQGLYKALTKAPKNKNKRSIVLCSQKHLKYKQEVDCSLLSNKSKIQTRGRVCCAHKHIQNPSKRSIVLCSQIHQKSKQEVDCVVLTKTDKNQTRGRLHCALKHTLLLPQQQLLSHDIVSFFTEFYVQCIYFQPSF